MTLRKMTIINWTFLCHLALVVLCCLLSFGSFFNSIQNLRMKFNENDERERDEKIYTLLLSVNGPLSPILLLTIAVVVCT